MHYRGRGRTSTTTNDKAPTRSRLAALALGMFFGAGFAIAEEHAGANHLYRVGFVDQAIGAAMISQGDIDGAQAQIEAGFMLHDRYERYTNLCVTLISRQAYEEAMVPCKAAVRYSKVDFGGMSSRARERKALQSRKALALSNLGVLQALVGQQETARESFEKARARNCPNSGIASYNMSVLDRRDETTGTGSVALVGSTY